MITLPCRCLESKILFNTEALEKMVYDPVWVLENEEEFWSVYPSQRYTRDWAEQVKYPIDCEKWRATVKAWSEVPTKTREGMNFLKNAERIIEGRLVFIDKALPHICSYLPDDANLDISVHFTAYVPPRAFAMEEIVINMTATYWNNNPDNILNTMVHELFHVGYSYCENIRGNNEEGPLIDILRNIHSEGVCTYIGYMAQAIFPAPDEKDYDMLNNAEDIQRHHKNVNEILFKIGVLSKEDLDKLSWDTGVMERSYYVTGAHMCRVIEEKAGKEVFKKTLLDGPRAFFETYNGLVTEKEKLIY